MEATAKGLTPPPVDPADEPQPLDPLRPDQEPSEVARDAKELLTEGEQQKGKWRER